MDGLAEKEGRCVQLPGMVAANTRSNNRVSADSKHFRLGDVMNTGWMSSPEEGRAKFSSGASMVLVFSHLYLVFIVYT